MLIDLHQQPGGLSHWSEYFTIFQFDSDLVLYGMIGFRQPGEERFPGSQ